MLKTCFVGGEGERRFIEGRNGTRLLGNNRALQGLVVLKLAGEETPSKPKEKYSGHMGGLETSGSGQRVSFLQR